MIHLNHSPISFQGGMMPEFRAYYDKRQIVDFNSVVGDLGTDGIYCVDNGVMRILRYLVSTRGLWRSTYCIDSFESGYTIPNVSEFLLIERAISEFLGGKDMSCDLVSALNEIRDAILSKSCGGNLSESTMSSSGRWGSGVNYQRPASFGQEGDLFATEEDFSASLCMKANWLVDGLIASIGNLSYVSLAEALLGGVALGVVAFMSVPPAGALVALALAVGVSFALSDFCSNLQEYIRDNREDFICAIYNSENSDELFDAIDELIDIAIASIGVTVGQEALAFVVMAFIDTDVLAQVYSNNSNINGENSGCDECLGAWETALIKSYSNLGTYQNINSLVDYSSTWGELTFNQGAAIEFGPIEGTVNACGVWAAEPSGGVLAITADGAVVSAGGSFVGENPAGSYLTVFEFTSPVTDPESITVSLDLSGNDKPIYEIQFRVA